MLETKNVSLSIVEPPIVFNSVNQCYGIGDTVQLAFRKSHHNASTRDWVGLFPCDAACPESPLSSKHVPNHFLTEHGSDVGIQIKPSIDLAEVKMRLDLDFPVEEDMRQYEVRYFNDSNVMLGKTDPFSISLVSLNEDNSKEDLRDSGINLADADFVGLKLDVKKRLLKEIKRREDAEKAVESYSRSLGEQINEVNRKNAIIEELQSSHNLELRNNEIVAEEAKELQQQVDNLSTLYAQSQASIMTLQDECTRLGKELETTDKENSCLKFHIVNSEDKLSNNEEYVVRKLNKESGGWGESCSCKHNNEMLEAALEKERAKGLEVTEAFHVLSKENGELQASMEKLADLQNLFEEELQNERNRSENLEKAYLFDQELTEKIQLQMETVKDRSNKLEQELVDVTEKLAKVELQLQTEKKKYDKMGEEMQSEKVRSEKVEQELRTWKERSEKLQQELEIEKEKFRSTKQELQTEKEKSRSMEREIVKEKERSEQMKKELQKDKELSEKIESMMSKLEEEAARVEKSVRKHNAELASQTVAYNEELEICQQTYIDYYSAQQEELNRSRGELEAEISKSNALERSFQSKISEIECHLNTKEKALADEKESLEQSLEKGKMKIEELVDQLERRMIREEECVKEIKEKNKLLEEYKAKMKQLEADAVHSAVSQPVEISEAKLGNTKGSQTCNGQDEKIAKAEEIAPTCNPSPEGKLKMSTLEAEILELKNNYVSILKKLDEEKASRKETDKAYEKQIEELESRVVNESSNASRLENQLTTAEHRCHETEEDVKFFRQQLLDTEKKLQDGQCLLSKTMEEMNYLKNKVRRSNFESIPHTNIAPPTAASTPLLCNPNTNGNLLKTSNFEVIVPECTKDPNAFPPMDSTFTVPHIENHTSVESKAVPGIVKYNPLNQLKESTDPKPDIVVESNEPQPISVIIEGRKVPKKKGRRFSKPINLVLPPLHTVSEHHDGDHHHHHHHRATPYVHQHDRINQQDRQDRVHFQDRNSNQDRTNHHHQDRFNNPDRNTQFDNVRQHRNALQRENTYLKNKVSALVTDLLLMQKSLQDVVVDSEQKLSMLQLVISNQCALASAAAQSDLQLCTDSPNSYRMIESSAKLEIDFSNYNNSDNNDSNNNNSNSNNSINASNVDSLPPSYFVSEYGDSNVSNNNTNNMNNNINNTTTDLNNIDNFHPTYFSQYGVIHSPMKEKSCSKLPLNVSTMKTSPMMSNLTTPCPHLNLSPLAEEYTPVQRHLDVHSVESSHPELHTNISVDPSSSPDVYLDYGCSQQQIQNDYPRSFPLPLPPTPIQNDDGLIDVTEQLESIVDTRRVEFPITETKIHQIRHVFCPA